jgi:hypothetical protein
MCPIQGRCRLAGRVVGVLIWAFHAAGHSCWRCRRLIAGAEFGGRLRRRFLGCPLSRGPRGVLIVRRPCDRAGALPLRGGGLGAATPSGPSLIVEPGRVDRCGRHEHDCRWCRLSALVRRCRGNSRVRARNRLIAQPELSRLGCRCYARLGRRFPRSRPRRLFGRRGLDGAVHRRRRGRRLCRLCRLLGRSRWLCCLAFGRGFGRRGRALCPGGRRGSGSLARGGSFGGRAVGFSGWCRGLVPGGDTGSRPGRLARRGRRLGATVWWAVSGFCGSAPPYCRWCWVVRAVARSLDWPHVAAGLGVEHGSPFRPLSARRPNPVRSAREVRFGGHRCALR